MSKVTPRLLLESLIESVDIIARRSEKLDSPQDFLSSEGLILFDSIVMRLQVIGEQVKKLQKHFPELIEKNPDIEWRKISGLRDHISHDYESLNHLIIFDICRNFIPKLGRDLQRIIADI